MCEAFPTFPTIINNLCEVPPRYITYHVPVEKHAHISGDENSISCTPAVPLWNDTRMSCSTTTYAGCGALSEIDNSFPYIYKPVGSAVSKENIWTCDVCNKGFGEKARLTQHLKTHSNNNSQGGKRFLCMLCDSEYSHKYNLKRHLKNNHKIPLEAALRYMNCKGMERELDENHYSDQGFGESSLLASELRDDSTMEHLERKENSKIINDQISTDIRDLDGGSYNIDNGRNITYHNYSNNDIINNNCNIDDNSSLSNNVIPNNNNGINSKYINCNNSNNINNVNSNFRMTNKDIMRNSIAILQKRVECPDEDAVCPFCQRQLSTKWSLKRHIDKMHQDGSDGNEITQLGIELPELPIIETQKTETEFRPVLTTRCHVCPICQQQINGPNQSKKLSLRAHLREIHKVDVFGNVTSPMLPP